MKTEIATFGFVSKYQKGTTVPTGNATSSSRPATSTAPDTNGWFLPAASMPSSRVRTPLGAVATTSSCCGRGTAYPIRSLSESGKRSKKPGKK